MPLAIVVPEASAAGARGLDREEICLPEAAMNLISCISGLGLFMNQEMIEPLSPVAETNNLGDMGAPTESRTNGGVTERPSTAGAGANNQDNS